MTIARAMQASSSALTAERFRMDVIAGNIANSHSMRVNGVDPARRQSVVLQGGPDGVRVAGVEVDRSPLREEYEPDNPEANAEGKVFYSNIQPIREMVDMMSASRSYEANIAAFNTAKGMARAALSIGKNV